VSAVSYTQNDSGSPLGEPKVSTSSDSWTGGPSTEVPSKLDAWSKANPLKGMTIAIFVLAFGTAVPTAVRLHMTVMAALIFCLASIVITAALAGSSVGGVYLFLRLAKKIDRGLWEHLSRVAKFYMFGLLIILGFVSWFVGPLLILKMLSLITVHR
jgi:hypothetical protein